MNAAYYHRRTAKRLESAKHKARSELNKCGWATEGYSSKGIVDMCVKDLPDTIERVDALNMTYKEFVDRFERYNQPVILTGITEKWQANQKWTIQRLHRKYRNQKFKCGEDDDGYSVKLKMKYYIDYMLNNDDDSPLYIFDSSFGDRNKTSKLLEDYEVPVMFKDDLFRYAADKRRPPHRWFVMGPARSGTGIHIDPLGTSAWNALILGHKRWCLIHPSAPKALVKPIKEECGKHPDEAITWFHTVYNRVVAPSWYKEFPVIHAVQNAGEVMFVPSGWWHVVVNLDDTIAITQNFCSITNLSVVWPKTVKGRPRLSTHWYRAIKKHRPELIPCIEEINRSHNWRSAVEDDSSDSSSSSSSSDSGSSDSEPENLVRSKVEPLGDSSEKCTVNGTTKNNVLSQGDENTMNSNNVQRLGAMENGGGGHIAGIRKRFVDMCARDISVISED